MVPKIDGFSDFLGRAVAEPMGHVYVRTGGTAVVWVMNVRRRGEVKLKFSPARQGVLYVSPFSANLSQSGERRESVGWQKECGSSAKTSRGFESHVGEFLAERLVITGGMAKREISPPADAARFRRRFPEGDAVNICLTIAASDGDIYHVACHIDYFHVVDVNGVALTLTINIKCFLGLRLHRASESQ